MSNIQFQMGSNLAQHLEFEGLTELQKRLTGFVRVMASDVLCEALLAGAKVFQDALQAATPVGSNVYTYRRGNRTIMVRHDTPGEAKAHVIRYERKMFKGRYGYYTQETALASGLISQMDIPSPSFLIGYEKKHAYYMYWYEYGTKNREMVIHKTQYTTKSGKWSKGKRKFVYEKTSTERQRPRPFIRAMYDANMQAAFEAAAAVCRSRLPGAA